MEKKTIGSFIAALRRAQGLTQRELAEMLGVSDKAVSRWERDECYPDLTMIPVLAEIFGVSCDELLCGGRINSEERQPRQEIKTEQQFNHLINRTRTDFTVSSVWIYALTLLGFIAALVCNVGFNRAYIGFCLACVFYAAGLVWLAVKLIRSFAALKIESDSPQIDGAKDKIIRLGTANAAVTLIFLAATLPLTMVSNSSWGLDSYSWLQYGLPFAAVAAVIALLAVSIVPRACARHGLYAVNERRAAVDKLRLSCTAICAVLLALTLLAQLAVNGDTLRFADRIEFDSIDDFVEFMETPMDASSSPSEGHDAPTAQVGSDSDEQWRTGTIEAPDGTVLRSYLRRNENICSTRTTWVGNELHSISVVTMDQLHAAQIRQRNVNMVFVWVYVAEAGAFTLIYALKKKKL